MAVGTSRRHQYQAISITLTHMMFPGMRSTDIRQLSDLMNQLSEHMYLAALRSR